MHIVIQKELLERAPGIYDMVRKAVELVLWQVKPRKLSIRETRLIGATGCVYRTGLDTFVIEVAELDAMTMVRTLVHELQHIAQFLSGKLKQVTGGWVWCDRFFGRQTPYSERPWEIEAKSTAKRVVSYLGDVL